MNTACSPSSLNLALFYVVPVSGDKGNVSRARVPEAMLCAVLIAQSCKQFSMLVHFSNATSRNMIYKFFGELDPLHLM